MRTAPLQFKLPTKSESTTLIQMPDYHQGIWNMSGAFSYNVPAQISSGIVGFEPLNAGTIRLMASVFNARVPEAAFLRDIDGDF